jgi:hypothetical protein
MYILTEADAAAIRETYETGGELSAAIELRRRFPGITDNAKARAIAGWQPLPSSPERAPRRSRKAKAPRQGSIMCRTWRMRPELDRTARWSGPMSPSRI